MGKISCWSAEGGVVSLFDPRLLHGLRVLERKEEMRRRYGVYTPRRVNRQGVVKATQRGPDLIEV